MKHMNLRLTTIQTVHNAAELLASSPAALSCAPAHRVSVNSRDRREATGVFFKN